MHLKKNSKATAISMFFLLSILVITTTATLTSAYTAVPDRETGTVVGISPTHVGVGQQVLVNIMTYPAPSGPTFYAQDVTAGLLGGLNNTSVTIEKPDGTKDTFMPVDETLKHAGIEIPGQSQIVGALLFYYYPDQVGTYKFSASFGGKTYTTDNVYKSLNLSVYYKPSSTKSPTELTVQQDPVLAGILNGYPWSPLPNDYWQHPVQTDNREWTKISGDWTQGNILVQQYISSYNEYSTAPKSSHIVWANQVSLGGLVGGEWQSLPYDGGGGAANILLGGKIYQGGSPGTFDCIDVRTGQKLWSASGNPTLAHRLDPFFQTASQVSEGGISVSLWEAPGTAGTWKRYNPFNGALVQTITNVPNNLNTIAFTDGSPIVIVNQSPQGDRPSGSDPGFNKTRPMGVSYSNLIKWNLTKVTGNNWVTGIEWNVSTIDTSLDIFKGEVNVGDNGFYGIRAFPFPAANIIVLRTHNAMKIMEGWDYTTGTRLWRNTNTVADIGVNDGDGGPNGPIILLDGATQSFVAYNVKTGQEMWRSPMGELPWGMIPNYCYATHNGTFYHGSYDGHVYAVDSDTGKRVWQSDYYGDEDESLYGTQPFNGRAVGADGVLYFSTNTVYQLMPRTRFHALVAIDEATGKFLWKLPIGAMPRSIAYGYLVATDGENGIQYCIGKGKSATSITAPLTTVPSGTPVLLQGTIKDMSPGAENTPCVSDADMDEWMDYLYGQNATLLNDPPKPEGVSVRLSAIGPNGDVIDIGAVTSDSGGMFKKMWTPTIEGEYTVYATFDGSNSYWGSYAQTALGISEAVQDGSGGEPQQTPPDYTMTIVAAAIAIIVAVVIVGALLFLSIKKR